MEIQIKIVSLDLDQKFVAVQRYLLDVLVNLQAVTSDCRHTQAIVKEIGVECPSYQGQIIERKTKRNHIFYGCNRYPSVNLLPGTNQLAVTVQNADTSCGEKSPWWW